VWSQCRRFGRGVNETYVRFCKFRAEAVRHGLFSFHSEVAPRLVRQDHPRRDAQARSELDDVVLAGRP
jgi:hypothetical protein